MVGLLKAEDLSPVSKLIENGFPLAGMEINKDDLPEAATQLLETCGGLTVSLSRLTVLSTTNNDARGINISTLLWYQFLYVYTQKIVTNFYLH